MLIYVYLYRHCFNSIDIDSKEKRRLDLREKQKRQTSVYSLNSLCFKTRPRFDTRVACVVRGRRRFSSST